MIPHTGMISKDDKSGRFPVFVLGEGVNRRWVGEPGRSKRLVCGLNDLENGKSDRPPRIAAQLIEACKLDDLVASPSSPKHLDLGFCVV